MEHAPQRSAAQLERIQQLATVERIGGQAAAWRVRANNAAAATAAEASAASPEGAAAAAAASAELAQRQEEAADRLAGWEALLAGLAARAQPLLRAAGEFDSERARRANAETLQADAALLAERWAQSPLVRSELSSCYIKLQDLQGQLAHEHPRGAGATFLHTVSVVRAPLDPSAQVSCLVFQAAQHRNSGTP